MRHFIFGIGILLLLSFYLPIPPYQELNHVKIIDQIGLDCGKNSYTLYLREIKPNKENQEVEYQYQYYQKKSSSLSILSSYLEEKHFFLNHTKNILTNCEKETVEKLFPSFSKKIKMTEKDIKKEFQ